MSYRPTCDQCGAPIRMQVLRPLVWITYQCGRKWSRARGYSGICGPLRVACTWCNGMGGMPVARWAELTGTPYPRSIDLDTMCPRCCGTGCEPAAMNS